MSLRIAFCASRAPIAQAALASLTNRYGDHAEQGADVIVALGGDGFMLQTCLLYTSPSPRDLSTSRMPSSA